MTKKEFIELSGERRPPTYEQLQENGVKTGSDMEGTVLFYDCNGIEYAVLQDNTLILKKEWDKQGF